MVLERPYYSLVQDILYRVIKNGTLRLLAPTEYRHSLFLGAHAGNFLGNLRNHKVFSQFSHHYWWEGMRRDVATWC